GTRRAKKLIPNEATASPRTWAGTSWTSIKADSGPFIPVNSAVRVSAASGEQTASRRPGWPGRRSHSASFRRRNDRWALSYGGGLVRPVAAGEKRSKTNNRGGLDQSESSEVGNERGRRRRK